MAELAFPPFRRILTVVLPLDHALQLFDSSESRTEASFTFMRDGVTRGEAVVMVVPPAEWEAIRRKSRERQFDIDVARATGRVVLKDAAAFATELLYRDRMDWTRFHAAMGAQVRRLAGNGGVRIYGETVDLLVRQDAFALAAQLEAIWNRLAEEIPMKIFCGYLSEHFGNPRDAASLRRICGLHSQCSAAATDALGSFLLKTHAC